VANIKSAKKRARQAEIRRDRNRALRSEYRTALKKARQALETGAEDKEAVVRTAVGVLDSAATKGILHRNASARLKSQLHRKLAG